MAISTVPEALKAFAAGEFLIVIDNPSRENEGDLIISAAHVTPQKMAFMIRHTSGFICVPMSESRLQELELPDMVERNEESLRTAYTISCDARHNVTTGISATDRAHTCNVLADPATKHTDLVRPGHVLPLRAREGGVIERDGHTEAAVDLCALTGLVQCAAISEIVRDEDGNPARTPELLELGQAWGIRVITIEDLKTHRLSLTKAHGTRAFDSIPLVDTTLLSSILYTACSFFLLDLHLRRLRNSSARLGWATPDELDIQRHLYAAVLGRAHLTLRLRLTLERTGTINVEATEFAVQRNLLGPFASGHGLHGNTESSDAGAPWTVLVDTQCTPTQALLPLIQNKTTSRDHYTAPLVRAGASLMRKEEVLLFNEDDEMTEGTITNVIFKRMGKWVTPSLSSGLLDGVVRQKLLGDGHITEQVIRRSDLVDGEHVLLCNAVRGVLPAIIRLTKA